ncbi:MAG: M28 family peptidase, partial [Planctomycetes bacterium]|nr:M28 family peptidase [Planctomycetota bacterium]
MYRTRKRFFLVTFADFASSRFNPNRSRLFLLGVACVLSGCAATRPAPAARDVARVRADVAALCDPAMEGRGVTTEGIDRARDYLAQRFEAIGLARAAVGEAGEPSYLQPVPLYLDEGQIIRHNVVGTRPGRGKLADEWIVIAAHYDHLGFGSGNSRAPDAIGRLHPGADDNASGVAALLWIAEQMHTRWHTDDKPRRSVVFVALTAEEIGQLGAHLFVIQRRRLGPEARVVAMLNLDMVGNLTD